jgi:hypothetical protein
MLKPLAYPASAQLVQIWSADRDPQAPCTIAGVMLPETRLEAAWLDEHPDIYRPFSRLEIDGRHLGGAVAIGRLKPGVTVEAAPDPIEVFSLAT